MNKFIIVCLSLVLFSCNKDAELVDQNLSNDLLQFQKVDSFQLKSYTVQDNVANGKDIGNVLLGSIVDPRFANTKASFYTQLGLSQNAFDLGNNPVLDSVVLVLNQVSSYGNLNANFNLFVYRVDHTISEESTYLNNTVLNVSAPPVAELNNFTFNSSAEQIRIKLSSDFATELFNQFGTSVMESTANFQEFLNGLYLTAFSDIGDGIVNFNLNTDISKMTLYYTNDDLEDASYDYLIENSEVSINQYTHNTTNSLAQLAIDDGADNEEVSYVSSMSNVRTILKFPDLSTFQKNIVNTATLTVYQADYGSNLSIAFPEPDELFLFQNQNDTGVLFLPDFSINNPGAFGGNKELVTIDGQNLNQYSFNITNYIQNLIDETAVSDELFIATISNNVANRIIINGGAHPTAPIKLEILYTEQK